MQNTAALKKALTDYLKSETAYVHPESKEPYQPNPNLSDKKWEDISNRAESVALYEASLASDATRGVLFLDGHVERMIESKWLPLKKEQGIS